MTTATANNVHDINEAAGKAEQGEALTTWGKTWRIILLALAIIVVCGAVVAGATYASGFLAAAGLAATTTAILGDVIVAVAMLINGCVTWFGAGMIEKVLKAKKAA